MKLTDEERAMLSGECGPLRHWAIAHQIQVGRYFHATDLVQIAQAHIMCDTESLGEAGVQWLERWMGLPDAQRRVRVPTITDPRGTDFFAAPRLKQENWMVERERRTTVALESCGILMTNTCINYQTIMPPLLGEHVAYGDTGVVIYTNSVLGARSNFEGGPSAFAAALTGCTPRYGYHLEARRQPTLHIVTTFTPQSLDGWGALGAMVGKLAGDYWSVPLVSGLERIPGSDEMKHFGAAAASFGSVALFHLSGITPEAKLARDFSASVSSLPQFRLGGRDLEAFRQRYGQTTGKVDLVVFSAPQLSIVEIQQVADLLAGRQVKIPLLAITSPQVKPDADRMGLTARIEAAGGTVLAGMCFYNSYAREMAEANGWKSLASNSAKLVNIIGGYGYSPTLLSMEQCIDVACAGGSV
ncbi:aconitase X catalytic domain-containing protein [Acidiphilium sp. AL]|uniref:Aconitase X catalytic domain-containing protein n=1 Tax=Acidiphilium iwatense TaxID=768198 RepID=A0ABS9DZZ6_9PROT|nr:MULTISPECIES: aconitase X catalytic domain-containing protein [Acidiphilium]MCF3948322.1 aconitase X catalytic domain-containing protein [Acidiphilium iwatense]MCU4162160.1 aconitase X catalytic domain-containing protein [Acidiphilium sp. AL]